ncbi:MAG: NAD(+) synthase [Rhizobiaceae bacterium]
MAHFNNLYRHGFVRVATATPVVALADPAENGRRIAELAREAHGRDVGLLVFPELCVSGYSIDDLLQQDALLNACETALAEIAKATKGLLPLVLVGSPLKVRGRLYNTAIAIHDGAILGAVPKTYLPNYREFYERRHFTPGNEATDETVLIARQPVPFGTDLLFEADRMHSFTVGVEICEDVWTPVPPSSLAALAGATVIANLSASNVTIGKSDYRHAMCRVQSARCFAGYLYSAAGIGESTTDLAWDGHAMIYENGTLLAESARFASEAQLSVADVDVELLTQERLRHGSFGDSVAQNKKSFRRIGFTFTPPLERDAPLDRKLDRFPFVPDDAERLDELCFEAYNIQVAGLAQRLRSTDIKRIVIGVSGGLDSTHALLIAEQAFDNLGLPRENILAYTLPGFATSSGTRTNAHALMKALSVTAKELDITAASRQMLENIEHPFADGEPVHDVTFENVQAGARTSLLFRLANHEDAIVLGTGDLSEMALGWCTYGVGDHMSHYNVNASVPKTLIQHLIRWVAARDETVRDVVLKILETEISPELVPSADDGAPAQRTEDFVGPYELQDFNLYYITRHGFVPSRVAFLAMSAWADREAGEWPPHFPLGKRNQYSLAEIRKWLKLFLFRFFQISQFKRSAVPNGPKVASGGSLSPRGDWRAPSDGSADLWLAELEAEVPEK